MQHHGQVEEIDAKKLLGEIDKKIFYLKDTLTSVEMLDNKERIAHQSALSEIFTREELDAWIQTQKLEEEVIKEDDLIIKKGDPNGNCIWFVSTGEVRERAKEMDSNAVDVGHSLELKAG